MDNPPTLAPPAAPATPPAWPAAAGRASRAGAEPANRCNTGCCCCCWGGEVAGAARRGAAPGDGCCCLWEVLGVGDSKSRSLHSGMHTTKLSHRLQGPPPCWHAATINKGCPAPPPAGAPTPDTGFPLPRVTPTFQYKQHTHTHTLLPCLTCPAPAAARHSCRTATWPRCWPLGPGQGRAHPGPGPHR